MDISEDHIYQIFRFFLFIYDFNLHTVCNAYTTFSSINLPISMCRIEGYFPNVTLYFAGGAAMLLSPSSYLYKEMLTVCVFALISSQMVCCTLVGGPPRKSPVIFSGFYFVTMH